MIEVTCARCLRTDHVRCAVLGCACTCRNHRFHEPDGPRDSTTRERQRAERKARMRLTSDPLAAVPLPKGARRPKPAPKVPADFPYEARQRKGRYMTPLQVEWVPRLKAHGMTVQQIGELLGGFKHVAVVQVLNKAKVAA